MFELSDEVEVVEGWRVDSLETADWVLGRLADIRREQEENEKLVALQTSKLKLRLDQIQSPLVAKEMFLLGALGAYAQEHKAELLGSGKKKSRALPHGSICWRKTGGKLKVADSAALLAWAQSQPPESGFVRFTEAPDVEAIKAVVTKTGEVPPGMTVDPEVDVLDLKPEVTTVTQ